MAKRNLYVLNEYTKQDYKIWGIQGLSFGRPIRLKSLLYFGAVLGIMCIVRIIPILGILLKPLPVAMYFIIPAFLTYLLTDVNTEGRNPLQYLRACILYLIRKKRGYSYYRGKTLERPKSYKFHSLMNAGYLTYKDEDEGGNKDDSKI